MKLLRPGRRGSEVTITTLARRFGLTERAVRYYEERGLLSAGRDAWNRRIYDARGRAQLQLIAQLKAAGLSLSEFAPIAALESRPAQLRAAAAALQARLEKLERTRERLVAGLDAIEAELTPQPAAARGR